MLISTSVYANYSSGDIAVGAVKAGVDILLCPKKLNEAVAALTAAVESGEITEERIDESVIDARLEGQELPLAQLLQGLVDVDGAVVAVRRGIPVSGKVFEGTGRAPLVEALHRRRHQLRRLDKIVTVGPVAVILTCDEEGGRVNRLMDTIGTTKIGPMLSYKDPLSRQPAGAPPANRYAVWSCCVFLCSSYIPPVRICIFHHRLSIDSAAILPQIAG